MKFAITKGLSKKHPRKKLNHRQSPNRIRTFSEVHFLDSKSIYARKCKLEWHDCNSELQVESHIILHWNVKRELHNSLELSEWEYTLVTDFKLVIDSNSAHRLQVPISNAVSIRHSTQLTRALCWPSVQLHRLTRLSGLSGLAVQPCAASLATPLPTTLCTRCKIY